MNKPTDPRIFEILLHGFWIQGEILTEFRILGIQWIAISSFLLARIMDFACKKVRIAHLPDRQKCFVFYSLDLDLSFFYNGSTDFVMKSYPTPLMKTPAMLANSKQLFCWGRVIVG